MNQLRIDICSDTDYEKLVAEIYCDNKFVALISQESEQLMLEFPSSASVENQTTRAVDLKWFEKALAEAKQKLVGC